MAFDLSLLKEIQEEVGADTGWFALDGRAFGKSGKHPLKVKVGTGGEAWNTGFNEGCQQYARGLPNDGARRVFAKNCENPATMDRPSLIVASRQGIKTSDALKVVAWVGPRFAGKDPADSSRQFEAYLKGDAPVVINGHTMDMPDDARKYFVMEPGGEWSVPIESEPPFDWVAPENAVKHLKTDADFVIQVGSFRRRLEDEGQDDPEAVKADEENLALGRSTNSSGTPSPSPSDQA